MSRLISVTELSYNGGVHTSSKTAAYAGARCLQPTQAIRTINGTDVTGTDIILQQGFGDQNPRVFVSESVTTVNSRINAANTTNSIQEITLTKINRDTTTSTIRQSLSQVIRVLQDPTDSDDSIVQVEDTTKTLISTYTVDQAVSAILTAANA